MGEQITEVVLEHWDTLDVAGTRCLVGLAAQDRPDVVCRCGVPATNRLAPGEGTARAAARILLRLIHPNPLCLTTFNCHLFVLGHQRDKSVRPRKNRPLDIQTFAVIVSDPTIAQEA
jgi:hypothetical protein